MKEQADLTNLIEHWGQVEHMLCNLGHHGDGQAYGAADALAYARAQLEGLLPQPDDAVRTALRRLFLRAVGRTDGTGLLMLADEIATLLAQCASGERDAVSAAESIRVIHRRAPRDPAAESAGSEPPNWDDETKIGMGDE